MNPARNAMRSIYRVRLVQLTGANCRVNCRQMSDAPSSDNIVPTSDDGSSEDDMKHRLFEAAMEHVPALGWSSRAIAAGAQSIGLPSVSHGLFKNGAPDLITHFYLSCNEELIKQMVEQKTAEEEGRAEKKRLTLFVRDAVEARLRMNAPYIDTWAQAIAIMALPTNAKQSLSNQFHLADCIWSHSGDKSTDLSWYTKRIILGVIYKSSEIYMLQDKSEDYEDTWDFVDNRFDNIDSIARMRHKAENVGDTLWGISQVMRNVMGFADRSR